MQIDILSPEQHDPQDDARCHRRTGKGEFEPSSLLWNT